MTEVKKDKKSANAPIPEQGGMGRKLAPLASVLLLVLGLVSVNIIASFIPLRMDITQEGLYTLSDGSRSLVDGLEEDVTIKLYYSSSEPDIPVNFKTYSNKVIELLREYEAHSDGKITLEQYEPKPDTEEEEWATRYGIGSARLPTGNSMFFGMVAIAADMEAVVPFFDPRREKFLEYDISLALSQVRNTNKRKVGIYTNLPIMGFQGQRGQQGQPGWAFVEEISKSFELEVLQPDRLVEIPDDINLVILMHPKIMPERVSYAVDQFLLRGGKLLVFVDPNSRADPGAQQQYGTPTNSELKTLFKGWKIKFNSLQVVGDHALATRVNAPQFGVVDYPIWVTLRKDNIARDQVITSELEDITLVESGAFEPEEDFPYTFIPLMSSSEKSAMVDFTTVRMMNPVTIAKTITPDGKSRAMSALITGTFKSVYPGGAPPRPIITGEEKDAMPTPTHPHLAEGTAESTVVLVGDTDFISDDYSVRKMNFLGNIVSQPINDNLNFGINAVEFLMGGQELIHIRSRGQFSRPFTTVEELQSNAAQQYLLEEELLSSKLEEVKRQLKALEQNTGDGKDALLSSEQMAAIQKFRDEERSTRRALRDVRKVLRQDIESLGNRLLVLNMLAVPLLVAIFGVVFIYRRSRRSTRGGI